MKIIHYCILSIFMPISLFAQVTSNPSPKEKNTIYAEAFGQGFCGSVNYDRIIKTNNSWSHSVSAGFTFVPKSIGFGDGTYVGIPISYNWLLGRKSHHLDLGLGITCFAVNPNSDEISHFYTTFSPKISYRFQRPQGGLFLKATALVMFDALNATSYKFTTSTYRRYSYLNNVVGLGYFAFPWPGLSLGYTFK